MKLSQDIIIHRSAKDVFDYYADFERHHEFIELLDRTELKDDELGVDSKFVEYGEMIIGGDMAMLSKITRYEPYKRVTCVSIDGGNQIEQDFEVIEMEDEICKATYRVKVTPPSRGLMGLASGMLSPLLKSKVSRQMEKDFQKFKELLENEAEA